jgi:hypothetical protein
MAGPGGAGLGKARDLTTVGREAMSNPFEPKNAIPQWEAVFNLAEPRKAGDIISYGELSEVLGYDVTLPGATRSPIYKASERLLSLKNRTLRVVPRTGYRIAEAKEHEGLARGRQRRARRQITKGVALAKFVDWGALTKEQQVSLDKLGMVLAAQNAMLRRHDARIGDVETSVRSVDDRVTVMEALLRRHGIPVPERTTVEGETG